jgi:hypothetical protein
MTQRLIGQVVELDNHHEGYVSHQEFQEIQHILRLNSNRYGRSQIGPGRALLQGLVRCERHDQAMGVWYPAKARRSGFYQLRCSGEYATGGPTCISVPGLPLERMVVDSAIARIAPPRIRNARSAWDAARRSERLSGARERIAVQLAQQRVDQAKHLYLKCDPLRAEVRNVLEEELEQCARELARVKREFGSDEPEERFTEQSWKALEELCGNVRSIWTASTTAYRDRKEILRILIDAAVVVSHTCELTRGYVRWADAGEPTLIEILRPKRLHQEIWNMCVAGVHPRVIADRLNAMGGRTQQDNRWTEATVRRTIGVIRRSSESGAASKSCRTSAD